MLYRPSELHAFLDSLGIHPKKGLSQNFLIDGNIIRKIVKAAELEPDDLVLEVGPGPGALTQALLEAGVRVLAVEKDVVLAKALERLAPPDQRLSVVCDDIMAFDLNSLKPLLKAGKRAKVIANLPYHLTTPILTHLAVRHDLFSTLVLMVQEEVAVRFTAAAGTRDYSSITLFLDYHSTPHYAFKVSRQCFYPKPKVDSAVVTFALHAPPAIDDEVAFFQMTRTAFEHRRKMLRASLKELFPVETITNALTAIGQDPQARPETLGLEDWLKLYGILIAKHSA